MSQNDLKGASGLALPPLSGGVSDVSDPGVRGAIARAAKATGVDFSYLLAQARLESSLNPQARATTSSAAGLYQFTKGTWGSMLARHGTAIGLSVGADLGPAAPATGAALPVSRQALMALRYDPDASARMAAELAGDNSTALTTALGRAPAAGELYLAHFLGLSGATHFLSALAADSGQSAAALLPHAAAANRVVFFDPAGSPRSLGQVMTLIQTRMDTALNEVGSGLNQSDMTGDLNATQADSWPLDQQLAQPQTPPIANSNAAASAPPPADGSSMADTLRDAFGLAGDASATASGSPSAPVPDFVRSAYGRMQALGF